MVASPAAPLGLLVPQALGVGRDPADLGLLPQAFGRGSESPVDRRLFFPLPVDDGGVELGVASRDERWLPRPPDLRRPLLRPFLLRVGEVLRDGFREVLREVLRELPRDRRPSG